MKAARHILLAMAALGLGGCAALNRSSLAPKPATGWPSERSMSTRSSPSTTGMPS